MALQELYLVEAEHLLDDHRVGVGGARRLDLLLAQSEDVLQTVQRNLKQEYSTLTLSDIKSHLHNLAVHDSEQVTERRYAALLHQELDLFGGAARARVRDRPRRLLPGLELCFRLREVEESLDVRPKASISPGCRSARGKYWRQSLLGSAGGSPR